MMKLDDGDTDSILASSLGGGEAKDLEMDEVDELGTFGRKDGHVVFGGEEEEFGEFKMAEEKP